MSTVDNRKIWEIALCTRLKFAASYLDMMQATGTRRTLLQAAHTQDLDKWCVSRIKEILERCEKSIEENWPLSTDAIDIISSSLDKLRKEALFDIEIYTCLQ